MTNRSVSGIMLTLLTVGMLTLVLNVHPVEASGTISIRADGSIEPSTAPISTSDNITYIFTDDIYDSIVVERDNIVVDGTSYTVQGTGAYLSKGIDLSGRQNVTVRNTRIENFYYGIWLHDASNNSISGNTLANNVRGIWLHDASNYNSISGNTIAANVGDGIILQDSANNSISGNTLANNYDGIWLEDASNNSISGNIIANNEVGILSLRSSNNSISENTIRQNTEYGIWLTDASNSSISENTIANNEYGIQLYYVSNNSISGNIIANNEVGIWPWHSSNNTIDHNNVIDNGMQVDSYASTNVWDDGYPSGGNYWSDYTTRYPDAQEIDDSGIWDTPYVIGVPNQDNYPLMEPWTPPRPIPTTIPELKTEIERCWSEGEIANQGIVRSLIAKLNVAQKLVDKGKIVEAQSILEAGFITLAENLSGIGIAVDAADILIQSAEYILAHL